MGSTVYYGRPTQQPRFAAQRTAFLLLPAFLQRLTHSTAWHSVRCDAPRCDVGQHRPVEAAVSGIAVVRAGVLRQAQLNVCSGTARVQGAMSCPESGGGGGEGSLRCNGVVPVVCLWL